MGRGRGVTFAVRGSWVLLACLGGNGGLAAPGAMVEHGGKANKASSVVTGPAVAGVFRSTGANGEVEFNNFGEGEPVALEVVPAAEDAERALVEQRMQDAFDVAQVMSEERLVRERARAERRQARLAAAREERQRQARLAEWVAATQPRYYPLYLPGRAPLRQHWRPLPRPHRQPKVGPFIGHYRYLSPSE